MRTLDMNETDKTPNVRLRLKLFRYVIIVSLIFVACIAAIILFGGMEETVKAQGHIEGLIDYKLRCSRNGRVMKILVEEGDTIKEGAIIAHYEKSELTDNLALLSEEIDELKAKIKVKECELEILRAAPLPDDYRHTQIEYDLSKARYQLGAEKERIYEQLIKKSAVSRLELNRVKLEQAVNFAQLKRAEQDKQIIAEGLADKIIAQCQGELNLLNVTLRKLQKKRSLLSAHQSDFDIHAPTTGIVTDLNVKSGQYMEAGEIFCSLSKLGQKKVVAYVGENMIRKVQKGQSARIESNSYNRFLFGHFEGQVLEVAELPEQMGEASLYPVDILVKNEPYNLKRGSGATVEIITGKQRIIAALLDLDR